MPCAYITANGNACTVKSCFNGTQYCAKHWKTARVQKELGLRSTAAPTAAAVPVPEKSEGAGADEHQPVVLKLGSMNYVPPPTPLPAPTMPLPVPVPKPNKQFLDDVDLDVPAVPKDASSDVLNKMHDDMISVAEDELESLSDEDFGEGAEGAAPPVPRRHPTEFAQKVLKLGYFNLLAITESLANPNLDGLVAECRGDKTIDECLTELAGEYEESLGLADLDPHVKLLLCTGVIMSTCYSANAMKASLKSGKRIDLNRPVEVPSEFMTGDE